MLVVLAAGPEWAAARESGTESRPADSESTAEANASPEMDPLMESLLEADRRREQAVRLGDFQTAISFWAPDGILLIPGTKRFVGRERYRSYLEFLRTDPNFSINWKADGGEIAESGELGYTYGRVQMSITNRRGVREVLEDDYLAVWERSSDGRWQCVLQR